MYVIFLPVFFKNYKSLPQKHTIGWKNNPITTTINCNHKPAHHHHQGVLTPTKSPFCHNARSLLSSDYNTHVALHNNARWGAKANSNSQAIKLLLPYEQWVVTKDSNTVRLCSRQSATPHATRRLYTDNASWECASEERVH